jgi:hypothetical protein
MSGEPGTPERIRPAPRKLWLVRRDAACVVCRDPRSHPALRCTAAVGAAWLTPRPNERLVLRVGERLGSARKRAGITLPEVARAGSERWSGQTGRNQGGDVIPAGIERLHVVR